MKVVLTQDVPKVGDLGTIQDVKDGFARNFLIPNGMARIATPGMIRQVEERQEAERRRINALEEEMRDLAEQIDGIRLEIHARVGEQGRLFGSVTSSDIAEQLEQISGQEIDRRKVELEAPIREIGEFKVPVRLVGRLVPMVTVAVFDPAAPAVAAPAEEEEVDEDDVYQVEVEGIEAETDQIAGAREELVVDEAPSIDESDADEADDEDTA
ncbi:MAG: 50S ribosomal protein L9 [Thermomicrobiales bacterium]